MLSSKAKLQSCQAGNVASSHTLTLSPKHVVIKFKYAESPETPSQEIDIAS